MTILIEKGKLNLLPVTLNEKMSPDMPAIWLFVFRKEQRIPQVISLKLEDQSVNPDRYNLFELTEGVDATFPHLGDWEYTVYQMPNDVSTDPATGLLVELGKIRVIENKPPAPAFEPTTSAKIYEPQQSAS